MRRFLLIATGLVALTLFLTVMVWGIFRLQRETPTIPVAPPPAVKTEVPPVPKAPEPVVETKKIEVYFDNNGETVRWADQPLVKQISGAGATTLELDKEATRKLISSLPMAKSLPTPKPAEIKVGKSGQRQILRGQPGIQLDVEKTMDALSESLKAQPTAQSHKVRVVYSDVDGSDTFDGLRKKEKFAETLGSALTTHIDHAADAERNENLRVASSRIDGMILQPGEEFNFDRVVGERSTKNGFKKAGVISNGKVVPGLGGGVCQVSTTIYKAALLAGVKILERHNHSMYEGIPYADRGFDAAINWGTKNFRFKNTLSFPILISVSSDFGRVNATIYGESKAFDSIQLEARNEKTIPFSKQRTQKKNEVRPGVTGYTVDAYRIVTKNGSKQEEHLGRDQYLMYPQVELASN